MQLFVFSDGLTDIRDIYGTEFGEEGLKKVFLKKDKTISEIVLAVESTVDDFIGKAPQTDDVTLIGLQWRSDSRNVKNFEKNFFRAMGKMTRLTKDFSAILHVVSHKPNQKKEVWYSKIYISHTMRKFISIILKPSEHAKTGYRYDQDKVWYYNKEKDEIQWGPAIPLFNSDITSRKIISIFSLNGLKTINLENTVLNNQSYHLVTFQDGNGIVKLTINKDRLLPRRKEFIDESGNVISSIDFLKWLRIEDTYLPNNLIITDETKKGHKTEIQFHNYKKGNLKDEVFTKSFFDRIKIN
jgi:hypothetical protein